MISAKVIEHSIYNNNELISIEIQSPYGLDAELEKHGMICSNSSSKRAIPFNKLCKLDPYLPHDLRKNERGMQGFEFIYTADVNLIHEKIEFLHTLTAETLEDLSETYNLHKQHLNWYLVPFLMQTKIMTANKYWWGKMLELRLDGDADPNVIQVAKAIEQAIKDSEPRELKIGEWHLPYVTEEERASLDTLTACKVSSSRCARTSYNSNVTGKLSIIEEDIKLFGRLVGGEIKHETPLEHQATPIYYSKLGGNEIPNNWPIGVTHMMKDGTLCSGRLQNYTQFRHMWKLM